VPDQDNERGRPDDETDDRLRACDRLGLGLELRQPGRRRPVSVVTQMGFGFPDQVPQLPGTAGLGPGARQRDRARDVAPPSGAPSFAANAGEPYGPAWRCCPKHRIARCE